MRHGAATHPLAPPPGGPGGGGVLWVNGHGATYDSTCINLPYLEGQTLLLHVQRGVALDVAGSQINDMCSNHAPLQPFACIYALGLFKAAHAPGMHMLWAEIALGESSYPGDHYFQTAIPAFQDTPPPPFFFR